MSDLTLNPYMLIPEPTFKEFQSSDDKKVQKACQSVNIRQLNTLNFNRNGEGLSKEDILSKINISLSDNEGTANLEYEGSKEENISDSAARFKYGTQLGKTINPITTLPSLHQDSEDTKEINRITSIPQVDDRNLQQDNVNIEKEEISTDMSNWLTFTPKPKQKMQNNDEETDENILKDIQDINKVGISSRKRKHEEEEVIYDPVNEQRKKQKNPIVKLLRKQERGNKFLQMISVKSRRKGKEEKI